MPDDRGLEPVKSDHSDTELHAVEPAIMRPYVGHTLAVQRQADYVVDLRFLMLALWQGKWIILLCVAIGLGYGLWKLYMHQPVYEAYMVVAPTVSTDAFGGMRDAAAGIVRSLGISRSLDEEEATAFDRLQVLLGSISLAERLQRKYGLLQVVYEGSWNPETDSWTRPSGTWFNVTQWIDRIFNFPTWKEPDLESLAAYAKGAVEIEEIEKTPLRRLSLQHPDRETARLLMKAIYGEADDLLREQDRLEAAERKAYLLEQLKQVTVADNRVALIALLTNVEQSLMLLDSDLPYAGRILEPPRVTVQPMPPSLLKIVLLPTAALTVLGILAVALIQLFRRESP